MSARRLLWQGLGVVATILVAVLVVGVLLVLGDADPLTAFQVMANGVFGSRANFGEMLIRFAPITLIAVGLVPSLRIGLFSIGAPGQIGIGALLGSLVGLGFSAVPSAFLLPLACLGGALGGALAAVLPAILRAYFRVNEILSTLVFNFLVALFLEYLLTGPLKGARVNLPESDALPAAAWLPVILSGTRAHWGIALALVAVAAAMAIERTPLGYRMRLYGASPSLARQAGVETRAMIVATLCVSGAAAGIAGWMQVAGVDHRLYASVADTVGYTGLFAALMGRLHPLGILLSGIVFAMLLRGGDSLQIGAGVSPEIISALVGLILLLIAVRASPRLKMARA